MNTKSLLGVEVQNTIDGTNSSIIKAIDMMLARFKYNLVRSSDVDVFLKCYMNTVISWIKKGNIDDIKENYTMLETLMQNENDFSIGYKDALTNNTLSKRLFGSQLDMIKLLLEEVLSQDISEQPLRLLMKPESQGLRDLLMKIYNSHHDGLRLDEITVGTSEEYTTVMNNVEVLDKNGFIKMRKTGKGILLSASIIGVQWASKQQ